MSTTFQTAPNKAVDVNGTTFVYRELGGGSNPPLLLLNHLTGVLDDWDPSTVNGLAEHRRVVVVNNRGVGGSNGQTPDNVHAMANDAVAFVDALGLERMDIFGFSLGGFVAQIIAQQHPSLCRKVILAGTGPAGGVGIVDIAVVLKDAITKADAFQRHPKSYLFFSQSRAGQLAAGAFLERLSERRNDRDAPISEASVQAQVTAIVAWGSEKSRANVINHPVLVANGDHDVMIPTPNSIDLANRLPNAQLSIFPDAGHAAVFEHQAAFLPQVRAFLDH